MHMPTFFVVKVQPPHAQSPSCCLYGIPIALTRRLSDRVEARTKLTLMNFLIPDTCCKWGITRALLGELQARHQMRKSLLQVR